MFPPSVVGSRHGLASGFHQYRALLARKLENSTRTYAYACTDTAVQHCGRAVRCQHPRRMRVLEPVQHQTGGTEEVGRAD